MSTRYITSVLQNRIYKYWVVNFTMKSCVCVHVLCSHFHDISFAHFLLYQFHFESWISWMKFIFKKLHFWISCYLNFNVFTVISRQASSCIIKVLFIFYLYRIIYIFCLNGGILFVYVLLLKNYLLSCFHVFCYVHICKDQTFLYQKSTVNWNKWNPCLQ